MICQFKFSVTGFLSWFTLLKSELELNISERISTQTNDPLEVFVVLCCI